MYEFVAEVKVRLKIYQKTAFSHKRLAACTTFHFFTKFLIFVIWHKANNEIRITKMM